MSDERPSIPPRSISRSQDPATGEWTRRDLSAGELARLEAARDRDFCFPPIAMGAPAIPSWIPRERLRFVGLRAVPGGNPAMEPAVEPYFTDTGEAVGSEPPGQPEGDEAIPPPFE